MVIDHTNTYSNHCPWKKGAILRFQVELFDIWCGLKLELDLKYFFHDIWWIQSHLLIVSMLNCRQSVSPRELVIFFPRTSYPFAFNPLFLLARFVLEPKSLLVSEQDQKLRDSEAAITSLQVCCLLFWIFI